MNGLLATECQRITSVLEHAIEKLGILAGVADRPFAESGDTVGGDTVGGHRLSGSSFALPAAAQATPRKSTHVDHRVNRTRTVSFADEALDNSGSGGGSNDGDRLLQKPPHSPQTERLASQESSPETTHTPTLQRHSTARSEDIMENIPSQMAALSERQAKIENQRDVWYGRAREKLSQHNLNLRLRMCQASARDLDLVILKKHKEDMANVAQKQLPATIPDAAFSAVRSRRNRAERKSQAKAERNSMTIASRISFGGASDDTSHDLEMSNRGSVDNSGLGLRPRPISQMDAHFEDDIEKSTAGGASTFTEWWQWKQRGANGGEITYDETMQRAAIYIDDARFAREVRIHRTGFWPRKVLKFHSNHWWRRFVIFVVVFWSAIAVYQNFSGAFRPQACRGDDHDKLFRGDAGWTHGAIAAFALEYICALLVVLDWGLGLFHEGQREFRKKTINNVHTVVLFLAVLDLFLGTTIPYYPRFLRSAVAVLLLINHVGMRRSMFNLLNILGVLLQMFGCLVVLVTIFTVIGVSLFKENDANLYVNQGSFESHGAAALSLFMLITTENYPSILEPHEGRNNRTSSLFFISFIVFGTFGLMGVFTGIVFNAHKQEMKSQALRDRVLERKALMAAFFTLVDSADESITFDKWEDLLFVVNPTIKKQEVALLFDAIDEDNSGTVDLLEFFELCDVLLLRFTHRNKMGEKLLKMLRIHNIVMWCRKRVPVKRLQQWFHSEWFKRWQLASVAIYIVFHVVDKDQGVDHQTTSSCNPFSVLKMVFLSIFFVEIIIRIIVGGVKFFKAGWNVADLIFIMCGVASMFVTLSPTVGCNNNNIVVAVLQSLVSLRMVLCVERFKSLILSFIHFSHLLPAVGGLVYVAMYVYANIGGELWCRCDFNSEPAAVIYDETAQFVDFSGSLLTLFQVVTSSNWHTLMLQTLLKFDNVNSALDRFNFWFGIFFYVSFYFLSVVLLVNLIISVIIDAYVVEQELQSEERHILLQAYENQETESNRHSRASLQVEKARRYDREFVRAELGNKQFEQAELEELNALSPIDLMAATESKKVEQDDQRPRGASTAFKGAVNAVMFSSRAKAAMYQARQAGTARAGPLAALQEDDDGNDDDGDDRRGTAGTADGNADGGDDAVADSTNASMSARSGAGSGSGESLQSMFGRAESGRLSLQVEAGCGEHPVDPAEDCDDCDRADGGGDGGGDGGVPPLPIVASAGPGPPGRDSLPGVRPGREVSMAESIVDTIESEDDLMAHLEDNKDV